MSIFKVRAALESAIAALTPKVATAWENSSFVPQSGVPYQRINLLPAQPENPTFGDGFYRELGIMQITLSYPSQGGPCATASRAEVIRAAFPRGATFTKDDVTVEVMRTPEIGAALYDADRYEVPVRIRYFANLILQ